MDPGENHETERHGIRLAQQALQMGWITPEQMGEALVEQARDPQTRRTVGLILVAKGFLTGDQLRILVERQRGDEAKAMPHSMQGTPLGKYLLRREVGRGTHGVVWEALDCVLGRTVALKLMKPQAGAPGEGVALREDRFLRETRVLVDLPKHAHVVDVYDAGVLEGRWFLEMEYVDGVRMDRWFENVSPRARVALLRDVALGVQHGHDHGLLHLNLNPRNILVDARSRPHIADFGLSKCVAAETGGSLIVSDFSLSAPVYFSPELADPARTVDGRADVYALGAMLYEVLTGKVPFGRDTAAVEQIFDKGLEKVCAKALAHRPEERMRSAQVFADALARWLDAFDPRPAGPRVRKGFLIRTFWAAALVSVGAGAVIAWNYFGWLLSDGPPEPVAPAAAAAPPPPAGGTVPPGFAWLGRNPQGFSEVRHPKDGSVMVVIPRGEFWMGSDQGEEQERPRRRVFVDGFLLDKTEVTVGQFRRFVEETGYITEAEEQGWAFVFPDPKGPVRREGADWKTPGFSQADGHPVTCVSWRDAAAYCAWAGKRLPTEAEWEKAARGTDARMWPWGNDWDKDRAHADRRAAGTVPTGSFLLGASPFGVLDLAGSVAEVCADWFDAAYYRKGEVRNPKGPPEGQDRVLKGGAWIDPFARTRSARRAGVSPSSRGITNADGFRGACDVVRGR